MVSGLAESDEPDGSTLSHKLFPGGQLLACRRPSERAVWKRGGGHDCPPHSSVSDCCLLFSLQTPPFGLYYHQAHQEPERVRTHIDQRMILQRAENVDAFIRQRVDPGHLLRGQTVVLGDGLGILEQLDTQRLLMPQVVNQLVQIVGSRIWMLIELVAALVLKIPFRLGEVPSRRCGSSR